MPTSRAHLTHPNVQPTPQHNCNNSSINQWIKAINWEHTHQKSLLVTSQIDGKSKKKGSQIVVELIDQMHETTMVVKENDKDPE
jgi:hypothetical protein